MIEKPLHRLRCDNEECSSCVEGETRDEAMAKAYLIGWRSARSGDGIRVDVCQHCHDVDPVKFDLSTDAEATK